MRQLMGEYRSRQIPCLAFHPNPSEFEGYASDVYLQVGPFMQAVFESSRCAVFIDESGEVTSPARIQETAPLATRTRCRGHVVHFAAQRCQGLIGPIARDQCTRLYLFRVSWDDARLIAKDWARDAESLALMQRAPSFEAGEYVAVQRFPWKCELRRLDFRQLYGGAA